MQNKISLWLPEPSNETEKEIQIVIPHRSSKLTRAALRHAESLSKGLDVRLRLVDVHVVPYGFPLSEPSVDPKHLARKLKSLAQNSLVPISAEVIFARDWEHGFRRSLSPRSIVLMAIERAWWRTAEKRLAARLRKLGHQV